MLRVAICEDDPIQMEAMAALISKYQEVRPDLEVFSDSFSSGEQLLAGLEAGRIFDVFLLDILMPGLSGIDLARELRLRGEEAPLVFLTASADYALDAFGVRATQYILKPVNESGLFPILDMIVSTRAGRDERFLLVSLRERVVKVPFSSIVFVESIWRTLQITLADGRKLSTKTIRVPFGTAIAPLLEDSRFLHAHKSFVINMDMVDGFTNNSFIMKGGQEVPIPRYKYAQAKARYLEYLSECGIDTVGRT